MPVIQLESTRSVSLALAAAYDKRAMSFDADKRTILTNQMNTESNKRPRVRNDKVMNGLNCGVQGRGEGGRSRLCADLGRYLDNGKILEALPFAITVQIFVITFATG